MKKILTAIFVCITCSLLSMGCIDGDIFPPDNIKYQIVNGLDGHLGGGVKLTWAPYDADVGISIDGVQVAVVTTNEAYVYTPGNEIEVYAVIDGEQAGYSAYIDISLAIETPYLDVWSINDPDPNHPSGFGFDTTGSVTSYSLFRDSVKIDFYVGINTDSALCFKSPHLHIPSPISSEHNSTCQESTFYDSLETVPAATSQYFEYESEIENNGTYSFWLDDDGEYDTTGHFGKMLVVGIECDKVALKLAYQTVPGLRWVKTD